MESKLLILVGLPGMRKATGNHPSEKAPAIFDEIVKSSFLLNSGIQEFRNCELFKVITTLSIRKNGQVATFYEAIIFSFTIEYLQANNTANSFRNLFDDILR